MTESGAINESIPPQTGADGGPDSPFELGRPALKDSLKRAKDEYKEDRGGLVAAGMAFYWFLGLFPGLLAAVGVLGVVQLGPDATEKLSRAITAAVPGDGAEILRNAIAGASGSARGGSVVAALVGIALALWGASAGMVAMQQGLDVAYEVGEDRPFVRARLRALLLLVVTAVFGGTATALTVFGRPIGEAVQRALPLGDSLGPAFTSIWLTVRWVGAAAALLTLFAAFYFLAPNRESPRWTWITPGGLLGAAIWLLASFLFSIYVTRFGSYGETYGSLAGVVVLLLWLYLSAVAVMLGGEVNAELERCGAMQRGQIPRSRPSSRAPAPAHTPAPAPAPAPAAVGWPSPQGMSDPAMAREEMRRRREGAGARNGADDRGRVHSR